MAWTQIAQAGSATASSLTSPAFSPGVAAGDLIAVIVHQDNTLVANPCKDNNNNVLALANDGTNNAQASDFAIESVYWEQALGTETTITITQGGATALAFTVFKYTGFTNWAVDQAQNKNSQVNNPTSGITGSMSATARAAITGSVEDQTDAYSAVANSGGGSASPTWTNTAFRSFGSQRSAEATADVNGLSGTVESQFTNGFSDHHSAVIAIFRGTAAAAVVTSGQIPTEYAVPGPTPDIVSTFVWPHSTQNPAVPAAVTPAEAPGGVTIIPGWGPPIPLFDLEALPLSYSSPPVAAAPVTPLATPPIFGFPGQVPPQEWVPSPLSTANMAQPAAAGPTVPPIFGFPGQVPPREWVPSPLSTSNPIIPAPPTPTEAVQPTAVLRGIGPGPLAFIGSQAWLSSLNFVAPAPPVLGPSEGVSGTGVFPGLGPGPLAFIGPTSYLATQNFVAPLGPSTRMGFTE